MVRLQSVMSSGGTNGDVISDFSRKIAESDLEPSFIYLFYACSHDDAEIFGMLAERYPGVPLLGGTSCSGVMTESGLGGALSIGALLVEDPHGNYGAAAVPLGDDPAAAAQIALKTALEAADCPGELPELIWVFQAPGREEAVLEGLRRVVGDRCPVLGGSAADDSVTGAWRQMGPEGPLANGLVVAVLFSSGGIGFAFQGGYEPTGPSGIVTGIGFDPSGASGIVTRTRGRHILSIDGQPAAEVYNEWAGGRLASKLDGGGSVLADTSMCPLGVDSGSINGVTHYLLVHPETITAEKGLSTFATIEEGTRVFSMRGDRRRLVDRAGRVASTAASTLPADGAALAGGLVVYCGGCMLAVGEEMPKVAEAVADSFGETPFLGCFTFGEQGLVLGRNVHGNLMISAVAFGR